MEAPAGTLVIEAARRAGIEIPAFCYYEGLTLQAACRMCLVEVEKAPKLLTACTLPVAEGMVVRTETPQVAQARKSMLEFLLTNHPLDCPVCDKGGECELQDMTFRYGAGESRFLETKQHVDEKQWSPVVFYDAPRCILCFRCVRICKEGMGVAALGVVNRGASSEIAPNAGDHLECDECGMCIDICPVGALTSGTYRYQTRPWEMEHVGTICTHCADGCKTTLGVTNNQIHAREQPRPLGDQRRVPVHQGPVRVRFHAPPGAAASRRWCARAAGFEPVSWAEALHARGGEVRRDSSAGRQVRRHRLEPHHQRRERLPVEVRARGAGHEQHRPSPHRRRGEPARDAHGRTDAGDDADLYTAKAVLIVASDLAQQHPLLAFQVRANWRHHQARVYTVTRGPVREDKYRGADRLAWSRARRWPASNRCGRIWPEPELVIVFGDAIQGRRRRAAGRIRRLRSASR